MFFSAAFLIPAAIVLFAEALVILHLYYGLKGKISVPVASPATFLWQREYDHKIARVLFPLALAVALIFNVSAVREYVNYQNDNRASSALNETLRPILAKAASTKRDLVCTKNGFIAGPATIESDKIACAQVGDFRVINPQAERSSVVVFKVHSDTEVVQAIRNGINITLVDPATTVEQLNTAFAVK